MTFFKIEDVFKADDFRNCVHLVEGDAPDLLAERANRLLRERGMEVYGSQYTETKKWRHGLCTVRRKTHTHRALLVCIEPLSAKEFDDKDEAGVLG